MHPDPVPPPWHALATAPASMVRASRMAGRFGRAYPWLADEFEDAAGLALSAAAESYDPTRGTTWAAHRQRRLALAMIDVRRHWLGEGRRGVRVESRPSLARAVDPASLADPVGWEAEWEEAVEALAAPLPRRLADLLRRRYLRPDGMGAESEADRSGHWKAVARCRDRAATLGLTPS